MPKHDAPDFPSPGTILSFRLADGQFGACQILRVDIPEHSKRLHALVVLTEYMGSTAPRLDDPALRRALLLNHHLWSNRPDIFWAAEPPPDNFQKIGEIPLTQKQSTADSCTYAYWESLPLQRLIQWRWEHDRDALLEEEVIAKRKEEERLAAEAERRARIRAKTTLPMILKRKNLFPRWKGHVPTAIVRELEKPIQTFLQMLVVMDKPTRHDITRELRTCAKALNNADAANRHPIETIERDDIFDLFEEILTIAKHPDLIEKLDQWREW